MEVLDRMPWAAKNSVFRRLAEIGEVSNMSKEERIKYDAALRHFRDTISVMQGAEDKGLKRGRLATSAKPFYHSSLIISLSYFIFVA
ncbi:hypothetical protein PRBRB14_03010 [Hallella multisaccharivorax DSM 17128]|uniref:Uncharacterized protein n=2 Tax=Hallella multisaccharivorax TaxID=310514 RepID=F8NBQ1_9BACT|nr:hypothetical protein [Hallella multisaccharivorax]EGN55927.1 hypothetical protein Premu_0445 [Hallella multisaccharivorax DSM 17128]GJG29422.1 hypothetical protein PRBRB14_03010 [Hallella multisaccharivorax DSM 17128]